MATQLAMLVLRKAGDLSAQKFDFLLRGPQRAGFPNPIVEWLPDNVWASVQALKVCPMLRLHVHDVSCLCWILAHNCSSDANDCPGF